MNDADDKNILFEVDERGVAVLRVNRLQARNALNWAAQKRFAELVTAVASESSLRVLIISGSGDRAFVAGGDLKELSLHPERAAGERLNRVMSTALARLQELPIPVIAAVNGDAFGGGCEIVAACDLRLCAPHARFSFAHIRNGLTTGWGGTKRLVRIIGQSQALELLLTGRLLSAEEAKQLGLIHRIVPDEKDLIEAARGWAYELVDLPREALAATKTLVYGSGQLSFSAYSQLETELFVSLWETVDHKEAVDAFVEKRRPRFNQDWQLKALG
jgi:enoyl-CoA hydratase